MKISYATSMIWLLLVCMIVVGPIFHYFALSWWLQLIIGGSIGLAWKPFLFLLGIEEGPMFEKK